MKYTLLMMTVLMVAVSCSRESGTGEMAEAPLSLLALHREPMPGDTFTVAARIRIPEGWHGYWINPGDAGEPARFEWDLPDGVTVTAMPWPVPQVFEDDGVVSYGYEDPMLIPFQMTVAEDAGPVTGLVCRARWMICKDVCLPVEDQATLSFPLASSPDVRLLDRALQTLPKPDPAWSFSAALTDSALTLRVEPPAGTASDWTERAVFLPEIFGVFEHRGPERWQAFDDGAGFSVTLPRFPGAGGSIKQIDGLLILRRDSVSGETDRGLVVSVPVSTP